MTRAHLASPGDPSSGPLAPRKRGEGRGEGRLLAGSLASGPLAPRERGEGRGEGRLLGSSLAAALLFLAATSAPAAEPASCSLPAAASPTGLNSWPPCIEVTFQGHSVTGLPPFSFTWEVSNGYRFFGNPGVLDTEALAPGSYSAQLLVANPHGSRRSLPVFFSVESLRFVGAPSCANLGSLRVQCSAQTEGATEHKWEWGDGSPSVWVAGCDGQNPIHTFATPGTYTLRVRARNCRDPMLVGSPFSFTATAEAPLSVLEFAAVCPFGFCIFDPGEPVPFLHQVAGSPTTYAYDWDGNGITDQVEGAPVGSHSFSAPGTYLPRLTVSRGVEVATAVVPIPIFVQPPAPGSEIFSNGFESGDLRAWSLIVTPTGRDQRRHPRP